MKKIKLLLTIFILILALFACKEAPEPPNEDEHESINILFTGDILNANQSPDISGMEKHSFNYTKDGEEIVAEGYRLDEIVDLLTLIDAESWLMITATDSTTARINIENADLCYVLYEENKFSIRAPQLPPVVGIKDIAEITVVSRNTVQTGIKLIEQQDEQIMSLGQVRMAFFNQTAANKKNDIPAYKHALKEEFKVSDLTNEHMNLLYFENFDIIKSQEDTGRLIWQEGSLGYELDGKQYFGLKGIVFGTEKIVYDAYQDMKNAIDSDKRVMFILPDGLSLEQIRHFNEDLTVFKQGYSVAASVNPAISNVSLATIVTGVSPYHTGITERGVKAPASQDIFAYAQSKDKNVKYIEGNSNLILTSVQPVLNPPDPDGFTDANVYNDTLAAVADGEIGLIFAHFHGIDDVNHEFSPLSDRSKQKIIEIEGYIANLIADFDGVVIIVPDHGAVTMTNGEKTEGKHGVFAPQDMFVPYYVLNLEKV